MNQLQAQLEQIQPLHQPSMDMSVHRCQRKESQRNVLIYQYGDFP